MVGWGRARGVLALALALIVSSFARAQEDAGTDDEARALYDAGTIAYEQGRFENALDYFRRSHALSQRSGLLYNIGVCAERLRRDEEAIEAFERYLAEVPDASNRAFVEARIRILRTPRERPAPERPQTERSAPAASGPESGALVLAIGGGALALTGVACVIAGAVYREQVEGAEFGTTWAAIEGAYRRAGPLTISGIVGLSVGAAALAAGIVWIALGSNGSSEIGLGPDGLRVRGRF